MTYYVTFIDRTVGYATLTEARKAAIREYNGYMGQLYGAIDIYPNRHTNKPSGVVLREGNGFVYHSYPGNRRKPKDVLLNRDGTEKV